MRAEGSLTTAQQHVEVHPTSLLRLPHIEWLPDETLFSLCSRLHFLSGHHVPSKTSMLLFGSARGGSAHDVPAHLQSLVERLPGLGDACDVFAHHTLIPFYFPFHEGPRCQSWINQTALGTSPNLKAQLGILSSGFGAAHPLKACPECMAEDARQHGATYWHLSHQFPGVLICPMHLITLQSSTIKASGKDRFCWALPADISFHSPPQATSCGTAAADLAKGSLALHSLPTEFCFEGDRLATLYFSRMVELGWTRRNGRSISREAFEPELCRFLEESLMSTIWPWMNNSRSLHTMAERLIRISQGSSLRESNHPLNHLILQLLLFGNWDVFLEAYRCTPSFLSPQHDLPPFAPAKKSEEASSPRNADRRFLLLQLHTQGTSITHAAKKLDVTVTTAMTWACKAGIAPSRRPKILKAPVLRRLIEALSNGEEKQLLAKELEISIQTVTRVLLTEPGLHDKWVRARFHNEQAKSQSAWKSLITSMPRASSTIWRKLEPAVYAWLYRNDRAWLHETIANRPQAPSTPPLRRDWMTRDQTLSQLVHRAGYDWFSTHLKGHPTLAELCIQVPGLRTVLPALHKLPLTQLSIRQVCSTRGRGTAPYTQPTLPGIDKNS